MSLPQTLPIPAGARVPALASLFQSEREEKAPTSVRGTIIAGAVLGAIFFGGFGAWATFAPLASAAVAPGVIKVTGDRKVVQHLEGGIVSALLVEEGQHVEAGEALIRLDETEDQTEQRIVASRLMRALAVDARLTAEQTGAETVAYPEAVLARSGDSDVAEILAAQDALFDARVKSVKGGLAVLDEQIAQLAEEIRAYEAQITSWRTALVLVNEEIRDTQTLFDKGLTRKPEFNARKRAAAELKGNISRNQALIARSRQAIAEAEEKKLQHRREVLNEIADKRQRVKEEIYQYEQHLAKVEDTLARRTIRAPRSGVVVGLKVNTLGSVVMRGEPLLDIVPDDDTLIVEANVRPVDIDSVHNGLPAKVRLTAFSFRKTPAIQGTVRHVSADRFVDEVSGTAYYKTRIELDQGELDAAGVAIQAGMPAEAMIMTGEATFLTYLLNPLSASMNRAFREQ